MEAGADGGEPDGGGSDLVDGQHLVGDARLVDGARHAPDDARGLVLDEDLGAEAVQLDGAVATVVAHAGEDDREALLAQSAGA